MTPEELFGGYQEPVRALCFSLRALVRRELADMEEVVFGGTRNVSYGTGDSHADRDLICYIAPYTRTVNLGFYRGALLPDPHNLLTGTGKLLRHIKFPGTYGVDNVAVIGLLHAARLQRLGEGIHCNG